VAKFEKFDDAFFSGDTAEFKKLLTKLKSPNEKEDGEPFIVYLARILDVDESPGKEEIFKALVDAGCDLNAAEDDEMSARTALFRLAFNNNLHYLKYLISLGADINAQPNEDGQRAIHYAIMTGSSIECAEYLLKQKNIDLTPWRGYTLDKIAKDSGAKKSLELLKKLNIK
jgi:ankyrin repeat protein